MGGRSVHSWKIVSGLVIMAFIVTLVFGVLPFVTQVYEKWQVLRSQNEQIQLVGNWKTQLIELEAKQEILDERFSEVLASLTSGDGFSGVVEELFSKARASSVTVQRIEPGVRTVSGGYESRQISLQVSGGYHSLARFISQVEQSGLLIEVKTTTIESKDRDEALEGTFNLEVTIWGGK